MRHDLSVERVRIDGVRLMATPVHDIIIDRGLSYCGKNVENCKWLSKEPNDYSRGKSPLSKYIIFHSKYIYIKDFYVFFSLWVPVEILVNITRRQFRYC